MSATLLFPMLAHSVPREAKGHLVGRAQLFIRQGSNTMHFGASPSFIKVVLLNAEHSGEMGLFPCTGMASCSAVLWKMAVKVSVKNPSPSRACVVWGEEH